MNLFLLRANFQRRSRPRPPLRLVRCGVEKLSTGTEAGEGMNRFPGLGASALGNNPVTAKVCKVSLGRILAPLLFAQPCGWCDVVGVEGERAQLLGEQTGASNFPVPSQPLPLQHIHKGFCPKQDEMPFRLLCSPFLSPHLQSALKHGAAPLPLPPLHPSPSERLRLS